MCFSRCMCVGVCQRRSLEDAEGKLPCDVFQIYKAVSIWIFSVVSKLWNCAVVELLLQFLLLQPVLHFPSAGSKGALWCWSDCGPRRRGRGQVALCWDCRSHQRAGSKALCERSNHILSCWLPCWETVQKCVIKGMNTGRMGAFPHRFSWECAVCSR